MERTTFKRTGLRVSVMGLGGGGYSKLGRSKGGTEANAVNVVARAFDLGINLFDSAEGYNTEQFFGRALKAVPRDRIVLLSKAGVGRLDPTAFAAKIDTSLRNMQTDVIDVYQFHGLNKNTYPIAVERYLPVLRRAQEQGKVRFVGVTEQFEHDTTHEMLSMAVNDDHWDSIMVGCNLLNFSVERTIFPRTRAKGIGTLDMFAVRHALVNQENLKEALRAMIDNGGIDGGKVDLNNPLGFLLDECDTLAEAAYRFCRHHPDVDVVLSGTGAIEHLEANVRAANKPPLSDTAIRRIRAIFGEVDSVSGKSPGSRW